MAARPVTYGRIDPAGARELFIRSALVEGDWQTRHRFFHENRRLLDEAEDLERRARRRGIVVDDAALFEFYDERIPASVTSARHFDAWWKKARQDDPGLLTFSPGRAGRPGRRARPARPTTRCTGAGLPLTYEFAPGEPDDGVTVDVPLASLNQVNGDELGLAGAGPAAGAGHRADPRRCPSSCAPRSCPRRTPRARCWPGWAPRTATCWTRWATSWAAGPAWRSPATPSTCPGCPPTCG